MTDPYQPRHQIPQPMRITATVLPNPFRWHAIHGLMTLFTCGIWSPVWIVHYALHKKTKTIRTYHQ